MPNQVVTGQAGDGHVTEIKSGLKAGQAVVVSGQFLLDSESQLQEALQKLLASRLQAKQGAQSQPSGHKKKGKQGKAEIWTCPMHPRIAEPKAGSCPICGMDLVKKKR